MSPYSHLSSEEILGLAEENLVKSESGPNNYASKYSNIAIGQALIVVAKELIKLNWESNYESNMERIRQRHEKVPKTDKDLGW